MIADVHGRIGFARVRLGHGRQRLHGILLRGGVGLFLHGFLAGAGGIGAEDRGKGHQAGGGQTGVGLFRRFVLFQVRRLVDLGSLSVDVHAEAEAWHHEIIAIEQHDGLAVGHVHAAAAAVHLGPVQGPGRAEEDQALVGRDPDPALARGVGEPVHLASGQERQALVGAGDGHAAQKAQALVGGIAVLDADRDGLRHGFTSVAFKKSTVSTWAQADSSGWCVRRAGLQVHRLGG
ncbi:MAG: hypothetical protein CVU65_14645 [Deltaproteobacteria bacterium HGW-Deltaproteobacteria-22]|nr:MAG: hypothetical protein CVU65_14645 [Deltaproteobacteria bacterium HGW-Deltaproteobacteria-22]